MAGTYRYFTQDIMSGGFLAELPVSDVYCSKKINEAGSFSGNLFLQRGDNTYNQILLNGSQPARTAIYVERNGTLVWGGIIWARSYASENQTLQLTGATFESYFDHVCIESNFIMQGIEQNLIFKNLIDALQAQQGNNIGLQQTSFPITGINRTVLIPGYEYHFAQDVVSQLVSEENGLEYTVDITGTPGAPVKTIRAGGPKLGSPIATSGLYFDHPGNITRYWWNESGTRGAVKAVALGHGDGFNKVRAQAINGGLISSGYPAWWRVTSHPNIATIDGITAAAYGDLQKYSMPYSKPTLEFTLEDNFPFDGWNKLGDEVTARLEDPRWPGGRVVSTRMIGWELRPAGAGGSEQFKIVIEDEGE